MSTTKKTIEVIVTTCDRPKCGATVSEGDAPKKMPPALVIQRRGKPDIVYPDLCARDVTTINNYCDAIEKIEKPKKADPELEADTGEPDTDEAGGAGVEPAVVGGAS